MFCPVLLLQVFKPVAGHVNHAVEVTFYFFYLSFDACHEFVGFVLGELCYALHLDFEQAQDVFFAHFTHEEVVERGETFVNMLTYTVHACGILKFLILVDAFLDEDFFEGDEE